MSWADLGEEKIYLKMVKKNNKESLPQKTVRAFVDELPSGGNIIDLTTGLTPEEQAIVLENLGLVDVSEESF